MRKSNIAVTPLLNIPVRRCNLVNYASSFVETLVGIKCNMFLAFYVTDQTVAPISDQTTRLYHFEAVTRMAGFSPGAFLDVFLRLLHIHIYKSIFLTMSDSLGG
jgi:hypothetical protein